MKRFFPLLCTVTVFIASCNSLFYYPTKLNYRVIEERNEDFYITSKSGNILHGKYFPSHESKALVLFFHGNYRNISGLYRTFVWLTEYGYDYIIIDYSGYGESEGHATRNNLQKDGVAMLEYAFSKSEEKNYPLIVIGQSIGGATLLGSLNDFDKREKIFLVHIDCSFLSYRKVADFHSFNSTKLPIPLGSLGVSDRFYPEQALPKISNVPVLVSHCRQDKTVPFEFGLELFKKVESEKWFWEFDCGHSGAYWKSDNQKKLADFYDELLSSNQNINSTPEAK